MRTTVTLEPDVARKLRDLAHRQRSSFKKVLNEVIRRGLAAQSSAGPSGEPFRVEAHHGGFKPGIDIGKLNQLADDLETEDFLGEARGRE